ncbi:ABC transporter ATP-binding protein [Nitriliruptor alkaliphilus]|uniref:ABC transporter ATP-binding protein n=1 Tax=Nitriliruptor alkaliphilus TaxID=427918 RepID=UPI000B01AE82|nr:ABC transporter ATP-binding protein [Nitriliruptor alkaliphilus]
MAGTSRDETAPAVDDDTLVLDGVTWRTDEDGTAWFAHDGWRYELDEDGFAYATAELDAVAADANDTPDTSADADEVSEAVGDAGATLTATVDVVPGTAVPPVRIGGSDPDTTTELEREPSRTGDAPLLRLTGVRSGYGPLPVLHGVDLDIEEGRTAVLFGLNGAGKTTTAMNICGALSTWAGTIEFDGQDVTRWSTKRCVDAGIVMVPEGRRVFPDLTVERNLQVGSWSQRRDGDWVAEQREIVLDYFPRLRERLEQLAGTLSGGEQQMLAIARGLMARPKLLIIDEASMGLAPVIVKDVFDIVRAINADGVTVLLIEQNVGALDVADLGVVMAQGSIVRTLTGAELTDRSVVSRLLMG